MLSFGSILNRSMPLSLPLVTLIACVTTLLAYGAPAEEACFRPLDSWIRGALLCEAALGVIFAAVDYFLPVKRRALVVAVGVALPVGAVFGWSTAMGLLF